MSFRQIVKNKVKNILLGIFILAGLSSCYEEYIAYPEPGSEDFNFLITSEQKELILTSRDQRHLITDPDPILNYNDKAYAIDRLQLRGATSLKYQKKSFSVNLDNQITYFIDEENRARGIEKFKLISMVFDYTYIEEGIAIGIFRRLQLWQLFNFFTEVKLNDTTQGLYLFIEDPEDYFLYEKNAPIIMRRDYRNHIIDLELNESIPTNSAEYYKSRFYAIYDLIVNYSGNQLYDSLLNYLDVEEYCRKIAVDMLLRNGDSTDEVYFYPKKKNDIDVFGVVPWDYDDIFSELPHEIGRSWAPGKKFGTRVYYSMDDIYADVGHKLLFSIEDDLDYKIATDSFLYRVYLKELEDVLNTINNTVISEIFLNVRTALQPFYEQPLIIAQSKYDHTKTSTELFELNIVDKENFLIEHRAWLIRELDHINN
jgi:hypothetical protein